MRLGIDIGGTSVKAVLLDGDRVVASGRSEPYTRPDEAGLERAVREAIPREANGAHAVGVCAPGLRDETTGRITYSANVPGLTARPIAGFIPIDAPLTVVGDALAAATDVHATEQLRGRLLAISLGTGVGASVLDDGVPLRVSGASPGHFGQLDVTIPGHDVPLGPDGGRGGLEGYIGLPSLRARYGDKILIGADDPPLLALARAIRIGHAVYRPDHVRLLGGVGLALADRIEDLRRHVSKELSRVARPGWTLACGSTDLHAARGAARLAGTGSTPQRG
jgi:predicted NBD/HSP70 family sugar kinase